MNLSIPLWAVAILVIVAIGVIGIARIKPQRVYDYGVDLESPLKAAGYVAFMVVGSLVVLVIKGFFGWGTS